MDKDKKEKGGGGEMSEEFNNFLGIIIIIGFAIMFWNAFKAGKIKENTPTQSGPRSFAEPECILDARLQMVRSIRCNIFRQGNKIKAAV